MHNIDTKLTAFDQLASLLRDGVQVLIVRVGDKYRIATVRQCDTEVSNHSPHSTFLCGLDPDGEYQIESSEADSLSAVFADAATLNMVW